MKILVYDTNNNSIEIFEKNLNDPMPYNKGNTLLVKEFVANTPTDICWTTRQCMEAFNKTRYIWNKPLIILNAFKRIYQKKWTKAAPYTAGVGFDLGGFENELEENKFARIIEEANLWTYITDTTYTEGYIHVDLLYKPFACEYVYYPILRIGDKSTYVMALQDAMIYIGYLENNLITGFFDDKLKQAVIRFQKAENLVVDGIVGCQTWQALIEKIDPES